MLREFLKQMRNDTIGLGEDIDIDRSEPKMVARPAAMEIAVDRAADHLGWHAAVRPCLLEQRRVIPPIEAQDHVGLAHQRDAVGVGEHDRRIGTMQSMIGRKGGRDLEIGEHHGAQRLGQRNPALPIGFIAGHAARQNHREFRIRQQCRRGLHGIRVG